MGKQAIHVLAIDPVNTAIVYAGGDGDVYKTVDGGQQWSQSSGLEAVSVQSLAIHSSNPNILYAGAMSLGSVSSPGDRFLFKTFDGGMTWSNSSSPIDFDFSLLAMDPMDPETLYVGSLVETIGSGDVFLKKTTDGGQTWTQKSPSSSLGLGCCSLAIDPTRPQIMYAPADIYASFRVIDSGLAKSSDGGTSWSPTTLMNTATPANYRYNVNSVAIDPINSDTVYAATVTYSSPRILNAGLFKTVDGGTSWFPINNGLPDLGTTSHISSIVVDADTPNIIYVGTNGLGVFRSIDGGISWIPINEGLGSLNIQSLALDQGSSPNTLYSGTTSGAFRITDDIP